MQRRALLAAILSASVTGLVLGPADASRAQPATVGAADSESAAGDGRPTRLADTYVTDWDAVGVAAFTAAGLSPAEGHTLFAYVAIAVYDSVIAVKGGYEPFAVDVDAPWDASAAAAVAAA
ncbi:MAG: hypothetical protein H0U21_03215, partial [Acidimicrobiia bacterium]|nr:hypothetical protein [Acidimicrobiia bacterium]